MRVLIATTHPGIVGGVETYLRAVLPRLAAAGFDIGVLAEMPVVSDGITAGCSGVPVWSVAGRPVQAVVAEVGRWGPAVVFSQGLADPALEVALADRFPTVLFAHNYHGTCISGNKCYARPGYEACQRVLGPACLAVYIPRRCGGRSPLTMIREYTTQHRRRAHLGRYPAVVVASRHMADEYRRHGVPADRLTVAPLFPSDAVPDPTPPAPRPRTDRVLFVGRVTALKGLRHLIAAIPRAAAELGRRLTLVVAGDGPDRAAAAADARRLGVPAEFLGWVGPDRRQAAMRAADVLGVPSVWPEPFGLVGLEAGCVGLPAVGYATGGIPDWLGPGVSGESAPGGRPEPAELAAALVRALAADGHLQRLRVGAWETAGRFTPEAHLDHLVPILQAAR